MQKVKKWITDVLARPYKGVKNEYLDLGDAYKLQFIQSKDEYTIILRKGGEYVCGYDDVDNPRRQRYTVLSDSDSPTFAIHNEIFKEPNVQFYVALLKKDIPQNISSIFLEAVNTFKELKDA